MLPRFGTNMQLTGTLPYFFEFCRSQNSPVTIALSAAGQARLQSKVKTRGLRLWVRSKLLCWSRLRTFSGQIRDRGQDSIKVKTPGSRLWQKTGQDSTIPDRFWSVRSRIRRAFKTLLLSFPDSCNHPLSSLSSVPGLWWVISIVFCAGFFIAWGLVYFSSGC